MIKPPRTVAFSSVAATPEAHGIRHQQWSRRRCTHQAHRPLHSRKRRLARRLNCTCSQAQLHQAPGQLLGPGTSGIQLGGIGPPAQARHLAYRPRAETTARH